MMPGVGFEEMVLLVVVAIIVIGPKDLPLMMRKFGRFTGKMRAMAFEFKQGIDELGRQAELEELRKEVASLKAHTGLDDLRKDLEEERQGLQQDVNALTAPLAATTHPAAIAAPQPAAYAGLSAEHPGYDAGGDPDADGPSPEHVNGNHVNGAHAAGEAAGEPHIIPDDHAAPEAPKAVPVKQDTPA